jgi:hypothetical protein
LLKGLRKITTNQRLKYTAVKILITFSTVSRNNYDLMLDLGLGLESKWNTSEYEARLLDTRLLCLGSHYTIAPR